MAVPRRALVTGSTGYIGSRLVPTLLAAGWQVRVLVRDERRIAPRSWSRHPRIEVVVGNAERRADLDRALAEVDVAWYLLHSMDGRGDFVARDRELARHFGMAAHDADVGRIVYLSGLHPAGPLSDHLASRVEVGDLLMASGVPAATLQAAVILGSGSASFEMLRHLTRRLPAIVAPKWLDNRIQPIAIRDVLTLLVAAADLPPHVNRAFDIGGPDVVTYRDLIERFASLDGLRARLVITVPVLTPRLASHWVGLVTPVPTGVARPLVGSLVHEVVCQENDLLAGPGAPPSLLGVDAAMNAALSGPRRRDGIPLPEPGDVDPAWLTAADPTWAG